MPGLGSSSEIGGANGVEEATPVTDAYKEGDNRFAGKIHKVTVEVK
jgi:hypothetical protein